MSKVNPDDYSPASTIVAFDAPLPLLRAPIRFEFDGDSSSSSPFVLAFTSKRSFFTAYKSCESKLRQQCNDGARIGCSIAAADKCKPTWWETLFRPVDFNARQKCEELEMEGCVAAAQEKCGVFARDKCLGPFRDARVAVLPNEACLEALGWVSLAGRNEMVDLIGVRKLKARCSTECLTQLQCVRGSELLDMDHNAAGQPT